jgi:ABC-2 type transport system permease protein
MSTTLTLTRAEARLLTREWAVMIFAFVFPPLTMLIVAGSFGSEPDDEYYGLAPDLFYVVSYIGIPIAAIALIGLPVAIAGYRERGVLRRFEAFGIDRRSVLGAEALVGLGLVAVAVLTLLAAGGAVFGIPAVEWPLGTAAGFAAGTAVMLLLGTACGLLIGTARGAQAFGLLLFFPMFLLSGGGPPPDVMPTVMRKASDVLPLTHVVGAIRDPWLGTESVGPHIVGLAVWAVIGAVAVAVGLRRLGQTS